MTRLLAFLLGFGAAPPVVASDPVAYFQSWAHKAGADTALMQVMRNGVAAEALMPDTPHDLASNSKVVTALCVLALVDEGTLAWDMTLTDALGQDAPSGTVAELVTHSAGIGWDSTQLRMGFWLNEVEPRHAHVTDIVLNRGRQRGTRGKFVYNNENYALLGRIIEQATGETYADACRARVFDPAGVSGDLSLRFGGFAAWGGWRMTMADHAALLWHWFGLEGRVGRDPLALPHIKRAEGSFYGLGMNYEAEETGFRMSHAGAIAIPFGPKTGAFAVIYPSGAVAAMGYDVPVAKPAQFHALSDGLEPLLRDR